MGTPETFCGIADGLSRRGRQRSGSGLTLSLALMSKVVG